MESLLSVIPLNVMSLCDILVTMDGAIPTIRKAPVLVTVGIDNGVPALDANMANWR